MFLSLLYFHLPSELISCTQMHKGGETTLARPVEEKRFVKQESHSKSSNAANKSGMNKSLKRYSEVPN